MLRKIFPPANELTLFVMATTLISLFFYMDGWAHMLGRLVADHFSDAFMVANKSKDTFDRFLGIFTSVILFPLLILCCVISPLIMPFTRWDLRVWCAWILLADCVIMTGYNLFLLVILDHHTILQIIVTGYCVIWAIYMYLCMEHSADINYLISRKKTDISYTLIAAAASIVVVFIAIKFFSQHWARAYSLGIVAASILVTFQIDRRRLRQKTL